MDIASLLAMAYELLWNIFDSISANPLNSVNFVLLVATAMLSYNSYIAQKRAGLRESLEQLDDVEYYQEKLKPILHEFDYIPFLKQESVVLLKYYKEGANPASSNRPTELFRQTLWRVRGKSHSGELITNESVYEALQKKLDKLEDLNVERVDESGIYFKINSVDPVFVRERTDVALTKLRDWQTTSKERFIDEFDLDAE